MDPDLPNPPVITKGSALKEKPIPGYETMTAEGLKEKFIEQPDLEDRPMTDEELDALLDGYESDNELPSGKTQTIIKNGEKIQVPAEPYVQNEEQNDDTLWNKSKELDIPEPEKNELLIPELKPTIADEDVPEMADQIAVEKVIPKEKFTSYKKRLTTEMDYHQRVEARINDLITKLENEEIKLNDLSKEDQDVIIDILNQNE